MEEMPVVTVFITREREKVIRICLNPLFDVLGWIGSKTREVSKTLWETMTLQYSRVLALEMNDF